MKKLFLFLFALVVSIGTAWADKTIYLNPAGFNDNGNWASDNAVFSAYLWNDGGDGWVPFTEKVSIDGKECYKAEIPETWTNLILVRQNPEGGQSAYWDSKWNQTGTINFSNTSDNTLFTITGWDAYSTSAVVSYSATFATGLDWENVYAYAWNGSTHCIGEWPGKKMTATSETFTIDGVAETIYSISFLSTVAPSNILFNKGENGAIGVNQTADLTFTDDKFYFLPTANPIDPTDLAARVSVIFSDYYNRNLTDPNNGWGGGPNPKYSSIEYPVIKDGHKVVHVTGTAVNGRTTTQLNSQYSDFHVKLWPTKATTFKIWDDNKYSSATTYSGTLIPGQWNDVIIEGVSFSTAYIGIELFDGDTPEAEFFLDHFYFAKPPIVDNTPPVLNTASLASTNCVSAKLTLKATDETSETITYKITDTATSTVYQTTGTSGSEINYVISGLKGSTEYTFSVTAEDENGNVSTAQNVVATTSAYPPIPSSTIPESYVIKVYGQYGTGTGAVFASGDANYDMNGRAVAKSSTNNSQFNLPSPGYDVSEMDYIHYDIMSDVDSPVALMVHNDGWKGIDIDGGLTAGEWKSFNVPISFFKDECGKSMDKVTMLCLIKNVADKTSHEGFGDFAKPYPTLYIANVFFYKEPPSTEVTVSFKNSIGWESVNAFAWTDGGASYLGDWPGTPMTKSGDVYTITFDPGATIPEKIVFNNGGTGDFNQTADLNFADGTTYDMGYYVVGNMNSWGVDENYVMSLNTYCTSNVEYKLGRKPLGNSNEFKVVLSRDGSTVHTWYPGGDKPNYTITADGDYNIFFRPNKDGDPDWHEGYIWAGTVGDLEDLGTDPTTGAQVLDGTWNADDFAALDNNLKANSYDLTGVEGITGTLDVINKTANPYCMFITKSPGQVNRNEVVWDATNNRYNGYAMILEETTSDNKTYDINTNIKPHVSAPVINRFLPAGLLYTTVVLPFDYPSIPNPEKEKTKVYAISSSSTTAGTTTVTFTEVNSLEAGKPYLVNSFAAALNFNDVTGAVDIDWTTTDEKKGDVTAVGTFKAMTLSASDNAYVLPGTITSTGDLSFQKAGNVTVRPFRAYITVPAASGAKINVVFDDATGIHAATTEQLEGIFNIYSIDGKLVRQNTESKIGLEKGIYIINGKKVVIK